MSERTLLLVGAGHAHLGVIDSLRNRPVAKCRVVLAEPLEAMRYSGMVPGWLAGEYRAAEAMIPLEPLVREADLDWRKARLVSLDPHSRTALLDTGDVIGFDICSIATGGTGQAARKLGRSGDLLDIRPIDQFIEHWRGLRDGENVPRRIAVVGGGAGGVELAFGLRNASGVEDPRIVVIAGEHGILPDHSRAVARKVQREFARQDIGVIAKDATIENGVLKAGDERLDTLDLVVAAIGSGAPDWPRACGLPVDETGFIRVDKHQRVCGFPALFAAGDAARRTDREIGHSGVHAVYAGPVLAENLRRVLAGKQPRRSYRGVGMDFYLLNTGRGEAILSYAGIALQGRLLRRLKDWLDRRWIARFTS